MTEKEIRKLSRQDMLYLLAEQTARADQLEEKLRKTEESAEKRRMTLEECGSIAEAALKLNDVFKAADKAVEEYIDNIKHLNDKQIAACKIMEEESIQKCEDMIQQTEIKSALEKVKAENLVHQAEEQASKTIAEAEEQASKTIAEAEEQVSKMIAEAEEQALKTIAEAEEQAAKMVAEAEEQAAKESERAEELVCQAEEKAAREIAAIDEHWDEIYTRICNMEKEYIWLKGVINEKNGARQ